MNIPAGPFSFDDSKVETVKINMLGSSGYDLSPEELKKIFGINPTRFGSLPKQIVIPVLEGSWYTQQWYSVTGWLYVLEPVAWVPQVAHGRTEAVSKFAKQYTNEEKSFSETKFNAAAEASISIEAGGSYMGVTATVKSSSEIKFQVSKSTTVDETIKTSGNLGDVPVHELFVYPNLRCKVIRKQRVDYTINDSSEELKWTPDSYRDGYWDERRVKNSNVGELRKLAWAPVPMYGNGLASKASILALPQNTADGGVDIITLISRQGWGDWYHYDIPWQTVTDQHITLAVPNNTIAFQPTGTWAILTPDGWDLSHQADPCSNPLNNTVHLDCELVNVKIDAAKETLIIIDMQNIGLNKALDPPSARPMYDDQQAILQYVIPAARKLGLQSVWLNCGLTEHHLDNMPPAEIRVFAFDVNTRKVDYGPGDRDGDPDDPANFLKCGERPNLTKLPGTELGKILLEDGSIVNAGRAMMRVTWNTALHGPLAEAYEAGKKTARPGVWIHKNRNSGLWNDKPDFAEYLEKGKICTLLFSGVNTDQCAGATLQDAHAQGFDTIF